MIVHPNHDLTFGDWIPRVTKTLPNSIVWLSTSGLSTKPVSWGRGAGAAGGLRGEGLSQVKTSRPGSLIGLMVMGLLFFFDVLSHLLIQDEYGIIWTSYIPKDPGISDFPRDQIPTTIRFCGWDGGMLRPSIHQSYSTKRSGFLGYNKYVYILYVYIYIIYIYPVTYPLIAKLRDDRSLPKLTRIEIV